MLTFIQQSKTPAQRKPLSPVPAAPVYGMEDSEWEWSRCKVYNLKGFLSLISWQSGLGSGERPLIHSDKGQALMI